MSAGVATLIVGLASILLPLAGTAAAWITKKITDKAWVQDLVTNAETTAAAQVETQIVAPMKADPAINTPDGHLTGDQAANAKAAAIKIGQTLLAQVGTSAAPHIIAAAIEAAVAKLKPVSGANLPADVKAGMPQSR